MSRRRTACFLMILLPVFLLAADGPVHAQTRSVREFNELKPQWERLAAEQKPLTIEGRYGSASSTLLRFQRCELPFSPQPGKTLPKINRRSQTVEVSGHLAFENGKPVFLVRSLRELPSDSETLRVRKLAVRREHAADWYRLGSWAKQRGEFYEDKELLEAAEDSYRRGIQIEHRALADDDAPGRMKLAAKVTEYGLADTLRQEFVHESYRVRWKTLQSRKQPDWNSLLQQMRRDLAGCDNPLRDRQQTLQMQYGENPVKVYRETESKTRPVLHRMFYSTVMLNRIEAGAEPDGSNGFQIAGEIEKHLPERMSLAEEYRERELEFRFSRVESSERSAVVELSRMLRDRKQPGKARQALTKWLAARTKEMRKDGPEGLMRIAEEYVNLLDDENRAAELLKEAYKLSPETVEIADRLRRLGQVFRQGEWMTAQAAANIPEDPVDRAIREGRVISGMSAGQVRSALGSRPASISRIVTAGEICEFWVYGRRGTTRLVITLRRRSQQNAEEFEVTAISQSRPWIFADE